MIGTRRKPGFSSNVKSSSEYEVYQVMHCGRKSYINASIRFQSVIYLVVSRRVCAFVARHAVDDQNWKMKKT
jgi:hypothetical protein